MNRTRPARHSSNTPADTAATGRNSDDYIFVELPVCPRCHSHDLRCYKSLPFEEGVTRYTRCRNCGWTFKAVCTYSPR